MALAQYREKFWFPSGAVAAGIPGRVFLEDDNVFAALYTDGTGTTPLPNPLRTDPEGYLDFWAEEGTYWLHIDTESFEIFVGGSGDIASEGWVLARIADHNADTTDVHGIPNTADLLTSADLDGYATDAELAAHAADTTQVHGIPDTSVLETQAGAQARADAAEAAAEAAASTDATAKANLAQANAEETAAAALAAHAADTTDVHGIPDTSQLLTSADLSQYATDAEVAAAVAAHAADTTAVHGIADTSVLATDTDVAAVQNNLNDHVADTTGVHGIANTADLLTGADLEDYATDAELAAHAADTTAVHGIADTSLLVTQADLAGYASDAEVAAVQAELDTHEAATTGVHGIADTATLVTDADLAGYATQAEVSAVQSNLSAHADATTNVHGIPDTADLLTQADIDGLATDADVAAVQADLDAHEAATTAVHGIPDTSTLVTDADLAGYATDAELTTVADALAAHTGATTSVHGINDTAELETQTGAQDKADAAQAAAIADAASKYLPLLGGTITGDLTVVGELNANGTTDWINAATFGALGDGTTDDAADLQAAIDATPQGGICYIPNGDYRTSVPLVVPPGVTVFMPHSNLMAVPGITDVPCRIRPLPTFTGDAVIIFQDQGTGGYATIPAEHRLINVMIDGSAYTATPLDGVQAKGNIQNIVWHGVTIRYMSGNGVYTDQNAGVFPYSWRLYRTMIDNCDGHGFAFNVMTDITLFDCQSIGNAANGFNLVNLANSQMIGCRAEWNGNHGYAFTGDWGEAAGAGALTAVGCSTDRNGFDGVHIDATGTPPLVFSGLMLRRDGRNNGTGGGGYAALLAYGATMPIVVSGLTVYPGTDDNGTGTSSPEVGVKILNATSALTLDDAYIQAATTPVFDDGSNGRIHLGPGVITATGPTAAPVIAPGFDWTSNGLQRSVMQAGTDGVRETRVEDDTNARFFQDANGQLQWGSGAAGPDVLLNRVAAGILALTGTLRSIVGAAATTGHGVRVAGDTNDRWFVNGDGSMGWGPGNAGTDVHLRRAGVNLLQLDDNLRVNGTTTLIGAVGMSAQLTLGNLLQLVRAASTDTALAAQVSGEEYDRFRLYASGLHEWGPGNAARDTTLERTAATTLSTNAQLNQTRASTASAVRDVRVTGDTQPRFYQVATGQMYWGPGNASLDTLLYRDQPGSLVTDGNFTVNGSLFATLATTITSTGVTAATNYTVQSQTLRVKGGVKFVAIGITTTNTMTTPAGTNGNITPDLPICTVPAAWRPPVDLYLAVSTGIGHGSIRVGSDGVCELLTWIPSQSISAGSTFRFTYTFFA